MPIVSLMILVFILAYWFIFGFGIINDNAQKSNSIGMKMLLWVFYGLLSLILLWVIVLVIIA